MKRLISLLVFVAVAVIAWWSTTSYFADDDLPPAQSKRYVEIFMNEFEMIAMNENGTPAYRLNGTRLERYNDSDDTVIKLPVIHMLEPGKQWLVTAESALLNDKKNTIRLKDNVIMQQQNVEPAVTIRTQSMTFHTKTQIARSRAQVDVTNGKSQLTSTGMIYNNITSELELISNVSGYHVPND